MRRGSHDYSPFSDIEADDPSDASPPLPLTMRRHVDIENRSSLARAA
jgi:hypothetical protein